MANSVSADRDVVVHLHRGIAQNPISYIHPLDRVQELRRTAWDIDGLIREMRIAG